MATEFRIAVAKDIESLKHLVGDYHAFESISSSQDLRISSLLPLLSSEKNYGFIVVATSQEIICGYLALCFGYSIEFCGRDAFIDELFVVDSFRSKGIGTGLMQFAKAEARKHGIKALHLEVSNHNATAKKYYGDKGFSMRSGFSLMSCTLKS